MLLKCVLFGKFVPWSALSRCDEVGGDTLEHRQGGVHGNECSEEGKCESVCCTADGLFRGAPLNHIGGSGKASCRFFRYATESIVHTEQCLSSLLVDALVPRLQIIETCAEG